MNMLGLILKLGYLSPFHSLCIPYILFYFVYLVDCGVGMVASNYVLGDLGHVMLLLTPFFFCYQL